MLTAVMAAAGQGTDDLMRLSRISYGEATARSAAMAGAFTSLGADGISMSVNPAGLAMYNASEVSITPRIGFNSSSSDYSGFNCTTQKNSKFAVGSFSFILDEIADGNFVLGIGYNRLNDFNNKSSVYGTAENTSLGQVYMEQLNGIPYQEIGSPAEDPYRAFYSHVPSLWNGIMGYQAGLIDPTPAGNQYYMAGRFNYQSGDTQCPQSFSESNGALHEYALSGAYNFNNKLYVGMTLAVQNMIYNQDMIYTEMASLSNTGSLDNFTLKNRLEQTGIGFNFKVGATLNLDFLRIGIAYHSPSWGNFKDDSYSNLTVYDRAMTGYGFSDTPIMHNTHNYTTPSHLLAGISATIAKKVIIAADYELVTYGSMKYRSEIGITAYRAPYTAGAIDNLQNASEYYDGRNIDINRVVSDNFKSAHNFRFAAEFRPIQQLFIRAGYAYNGSMYSSGDLEEYGKSTQYSGGIGLRLGNFALDLAYIHGEYKQLPSRFFKYVASDGYTVQSNGIIGSTARTNTILLTFAIRVF